MIANFAALPVPGMIVGLVLLLGILAIRGRRRGRDDAVPAEFAAVAKTLHAHFGLLFVPAGVGILTYLDLLVAEGPAILAAIVVGTATTIAVASRVAGGRRVRAGHAIQAAIGAAR